MKPRQRVSTWITVSLSISACGNAPLADQTFTVRDSAGVTIVENEGPVLADTAGWQLGPNRRLQIGSRDNPETSFGRIIAARSLSDGRVAVLDQQALQVRIFDQEGRLLASAGGAGDGPGEFQVPFYLDVLPGDTLLVYDVPARRATLFDAEGVFARALPQPTDGSGLLTYLARLDDRSWLMQGGTSPIYLDVGFGLVRGAGWITHLDPEGQPLGRILEFPSGEVFLPPTGGQLTLTMARRHFTGAGPGGIVMGFADHFGYEGYDFDGRLVRIVRRPGEPLPVTEQDREAEREWRRQSAAPFLRENAENLEFPETHPAYDDLRVDPSGHVWMQITRPDTAADFAVWSVFDSGGRWTTDVSILADLDIMEIGEDHILGLATDELDVQYVQWYELTR